MTTIFSDSRNLDSRICVQMATNCPSNFNQKAYSEMQDDVVTLTLPYGSSGRLTSRILSKQLLLHPVAPPALPDFAAAVQQAFRSPLDLPDLGSVFVPGDRVVVVIE